jgi:hypothetical protein
MNTLGWTTLNPGTGGTTAGALNPDPPAPPAPAPSADWLAGLKQITPALLLVGIATGAAFAIGGVIVNRYLLPARRS